MRGTGGQVLSGVSAVRQHGAAAFRIEILHVREHESVRIVCVYIYIYIYMYTYNICIYTHIYIYIYTHAHIYLMFKVTEELEQEAKPCSEQATRRRQMCIYIYIYT